MLACIDRVMALAKGKRPRSDAMEEPEDHSKLERLREAIDEGDRSGNPEPFDFERFIEMKRRTHDFRQ